MRGHGHASGRISITRLSITASSSWLGALPGKPEARRLTCSSVLLEALGVSFSAARGRCCMRSTEGYAAISRDRKIGCGFADNETSVVSGRGSLASAERGDPRRPAGEGTAARGTDEAYAHRLARAGHGPLICRYSMDETSDDGTSPARLRRHQAGEASLEVARTFLTRLRLAFFSSTIFRPRPICLANSDRRAA